MNHSLGLVIETLVAILLVLTIGYCMVLNRRLKRLKADEHSLKATIGELITATEIAERAIGGLKHTVRDVNENLGGQLTAATQMSEQLKRQLAEGDHVMRRLTKIAIAARPPQTEIEAKEPAPREFAPKELASRDAAAKPSDTRALAAAAQAFSERRRSGGLAA
jgi:chromosome segregation ATPase